jgi:hypothetical protein
MQTIVISGALIVAGTLVLAFWSLRRQAKSAPDLAWKPTGYRYRYTGHDESLELASAHRASENATKRTAMAAQRSMPVAAQLPARSANIIDIRRRQTAS